MTVVEPNLIPASILNRFGAREFVLVSNEQLGDAVLGTKTFDPSSLEPVDGVDALPELRKREGVYSITCVLTRLDAAAIGEAADGFEKRAEIVAELTAVLERLTDVYVVYAVTHFNFRPLEEMTVFIGGDCYRTGKEIKDFESVLTRTKNLAYAMARKTVIVFPDIDALHGGKKGEWIVIDKTGKKIEGLSEDAIVALGTTIIPKGIRFLNRYKEMRAEAKGIAPSFPARNYMRPDTASPDVLSGKYWPLMCETWNRRGVDMSMVTCLPKAMGGPLVPSSHPTGYGVVATATKLVEHRFRDRDRSSIRFLLEGLGGVGQSTVEALIKERGVTPDRITAFDKSDVVCERMRNEYGIATSVATAESFYSGLKAGDTYDVWINNGEGDNTVPDQVQKLLDSGVRLFCGAANNFLKITDDENHPERLRRESLRRIFEAGGWAWPDEASSGGGWTLAVVDVLTRSKGEQSNTPEALRLILDTIIHRNERLVDAVIREVAANGGLTGEAVFNKVDHLIDERVQTTLSRTFSPAEIMAKADVTRWNLTEAE